MDPDEAADLVNSFVDPAAGDGTLVTFSRIVDTTTYPPTMISEQCVAVVRDYTPREIVNGLKLGDTNLRIEGDTLSALVLNLGTPPINGDFVSYGGFTRKVEGSSSTMIGNKVVVIDVLVRG